jgi:hypothetical protein
LLNPQRGSSTLPQFFNSFLKYDTRCRTENFKRYFSSIICKGLEFIFSCLLSTMKQYQDIKLNPFNIRHCISCYCYRCFHIYNVFNWSQRNSSSTPSVLSFLVCMLLIKCAVWMLTWQTALNICVSDLTEVSRDLYQFMIIKKIVSINILLSSNQRSTGSEYIIHNIVSTVYFDYTWQLSGGNSNIQYSRYTAHWVLYFAQNYWYFRFWHRSVS